MSYNKVILIGNAGSDGELLTFESGAKKGSFSLATSVNFKQGEDWKTQTEWHKVEGWRYIAEKIEQIQKGDEVFIEGSIKYDSWENETGEKRYKTIIDAKVLRILGGKKSTNQGSEAESMPANVNDNQSSEDPDDDLPF